MTDMKNSGTMNQLTSLAMIGLSILVLFALGFIGVDDYVMRHGGVDVLMAVTVFYVLIYLIVIGIYVGFFVARFAKGKSKYFRLWGIGGFILSVLFGIGFPILLSPVFPYQSPILFVFLAPVLSTLTIMLLISIRKKVVL